MKLTVGQTLFYVPNRGSGYTVAVEKTGRIWASLSNKQRCDDGLLVDGGDYCVPGCLYESEAVYMEQKLHEANFKKLRLSFVYANSRKFTPAQVSAALIALGLDEVKA